MQWYKRRQSRIVSVIVKFAARDAASNIERAQYSVDGANGSWLLQPVESASAGRRYEFTAEGLTGGALSAEHTIAVRVYDRFENLGSAKPPSIVPAAKP